MKYLPSLAGIFDLFTMSAADFHQYSYVNIYSKISSIFQYSYCWIRPLLCGTSQTVGCLVCPCWPDELYLWRDLSRLDAPELEANI